MIKSIKAILAQDKEKFKVPRKVQDLIPIKNIWPDGIFKVGNKFSKSFRFSDINYLVASREDKESMFLTYSELLNSLDSGATTKITINNHRLNRSDFEESILMPMKQDGLDEYRKEYNDMLLDKATGANGITQEKYITITVAKKDIEEARAYFARIGADLTAHFANLGSKCVPLNAVERLRILHDFYRPGDEAAFSFDMNRKARLGHDFRDYICPDSVERTADHIKLGEKYARVLFLKDYASYIKDSMFSELTELNRNLMLSIDVIPIPTDEAVREVERLLLGVETNITGWQRRQNQNNNFSAVVPYDMELQRKESKEFLDDLTTRDQRMMFAVVTMVITADTKEQLDLDTETVLSTARKHTNLCSEILHGKEILFSPYQTLRCTEVEAALGIVRKAGTKVKTSAVVPEIERTDSLINQLPLSVPAQSVNSEDAEIKDFKDEISEIKRIVHTNDKVVQRVFESRITATQTSFYPFIAMLFRVMGLDCQASRPGDNGARWDAIVVHETNSIPIEIKSPTEEQHLSMKAIRQALENKVILLSRKTHITTPDTSSLAVGYYLPNDRAEVTRLIKDIKEVYGFRIGVIDLKTLITIAVSIIEDNKSFDLKRLFELEGYADATIR